MPVFEYLPTEILREILACLDLRHLRQVSLVSRFFNSITEPFLYASIDSYVSGITPTLRALVARPALARHVQRVSFGWWKKEPCHDSGDSEQFSAMAREVNLQMPWSTETQPWTDPNQPWAVEALALLLLHMVPNIEILEINESFLLASYLKSTLTIPIEGLPFKSLRILQFDEFSQQSRITPPLLYAMMRFPSLRKLTVDLEAPEDYVHDIPGTLAAIIAFAQQSSITHLSLHFGGNTCASTLQHMLQMPRALTHFSYHDDNQYDYQPDSTPFRVAIRVLRPTLKSLFIAGVRALRLGEPGEQTIGSLSDWPRLTTVRCTMTGLVGTRANATASLVDLLPRGIRELWLRRTDGLTDLPLDDEWTASEMTDQLFDVVVQRPELTLVTVELAYNVRVNSLGPVEKSWVDVYPGEMKERLTVASGARDVAVVMKREGWWAKWLSFEN